MAQSIYWADNYVEKQRTAEAAIAMIRPGKRVFIGSASGEPQALVRALSAAASQDQRAGGRPAHEPGDHLPVRNCRQDP
jgi:acyl-CoA hydrolase